MECQAFWNHHFIADFHWLWQYILIEQKTIRHPCKSLFISIGTACNKYFRDGITNGAQWYPITGGMQDYHYIHHGTIELTMELSCCKFPPQGELRQKFMENKEAMVAYLQSAHMGRILTSSWWPKKNTVVSQGGEVSTQGCQVDCGRAWTVYIWPRGKNKYHV